MICLKIIKTKQKSKHPTKPPVKNDAIELIQLRERIAQLEGRVEVNQSELDKKNGLLHDLKFQVDYQEKDLSKLNVEVYATKDELSKAELDRRTLLEQLDKQKDKFSQLKTNDDKKREKANLQLERENQLLREEMTRIQQLTKNVSDSERMDMKILCQTVMDSTMSSEEKKSALNRIQQLYIEHPSVSSEVNQDRLKYIASMMSQFRQSNEVQIEDMEIASQHSRTKQSFSKFSQQEISESRENSRNKKSSRRTSLKLVTEEKMEVKSTREIKQKVVEKIVINEDGEQVVVEELIDLADETDPVNPTGIETSSSARQVKKGGKLNSRNVSGASSNDPKMKGVSNSKQSSVANSRQTSGVPTANAAGTPGSGTGAIPSKKPQINNQSSYGSSNQTKNTVNQNSKNSKTHKKNTNSMNTNPESGSLLPQEAPGSSSSILLDSGRNIFRNQTDIQQINTVRGGVIKSSQFIQPSLNNDISESLEPQEDQNTNSLPNSQQKPINQLIKRQPLGIFDGTGFFQEVEEQIQEQDGWEEVEAELIGEDGSVKIIKQQQPKFITKTIKVKKPVENLENNDNIEIIEEEQEVEEEIINPATGESQIVKTKVMIKKAVQKLPDQKQQYEDEDWNKQKFDDSNYEIESDENQQSQIQNKKQHVDDPNKIRHYQKQSNPNQKPSFQNSNSQAKNTDPDENQGLANHDQIIQKSHRQVPSIDNSFASNRMPLSSNKPSIHKQDSIQSSNSNININQGALPSSLSGFGNINSVKNQITPLSTHDVAVATSNNLISPPPPQNMSSIKNESAQQTQTESSLIWPIVEAILIELGIDLKMIQKIQLLYFNPDSAKDANGTSLQLSEIIKQAQIKKAEISALQPKTPKSTENNFIPPQKQPPLTEQQILLFDNFDSDNIQSQNEDEKFIQYNQSDKRLAPINERNLEVIPDKHLLAESTIKRIFLKLFQRDNTGAVQIQELILKYYKKNPNDPISYDEFKHYYMKILTLHQRCGDQCKHLLRFFGKIGFTTQRYSNRQQVETSKCHLNPFGQNRSQSKPQLVPSPQNILSRKNSSTLPAISNR